MKNTDNERISFHYCIENWCIWLGRHAKGYTVVLYDQSMLVYSYKLHLLLLGILLLKMLRFFFQRYAVNYLSAFHFNVKSHSIGKFDDMISRYTTTMNKARFSSKYPSGMQQLHNNEKNSCYSDVRIPLKTLIHYVVLQTQSFCKHMGLFIFKIKYNTKTPSGFSSPFQRQRTSCILT